MAQKISFEIRPGSYELKEKRTLTSKTFQNTDGTQTVYISTVNMHYLNERGEYIDILENDDNNINVQGWEYGFYQKNSNAYGWDYDRSIGKKTLFGDNYLYRKFIRWGITTNQIPYGSKVSSSYFDLTWNYNGNQIYWTVNDLNNDYTSDAGTVWNDCGNGQYGSMNNQMSQPARFNNTLGFNTLIMTRIESYTNNWVGIGLKNNNESDESNNLTFTSSNVLAVTFTPAGIALSPSSWNQAPGNGGNLYVTVTNISGGSSISWTISKDKDWISTNIQGGTQTPSNFIITITPNYTGIIRNGTVTVTPGSLGGGTSAQLLITQGRATDLILYAQTISNSQYYAVTNTIQTNGNVIVNNNPQGNLTLVVGTGFNSYIVLNPGFSALEGSIFKAYTQTFSDNDFLSNKVNLEELKNKQDSLKISENNKITFIKKDNLQLLPVYSELCQNFPNPFNPYTIIRYALNENANVKIMIFNILGQKIKTLVDEFQDAGFKSVLWDGTNEYGNQVSSGIYIYRIIANNYVDAKKMLLIR